MIQDIWYDLYKDAQQEISHLKLEQCYLMCQISIAIRVLRATNPNCPCALELECTLKNIEETHLERLKAMGKEADAIRAECAAGRAPASDNGSARSKISTQNEALQGTSQGDASWLQQFAAAFTPPKAG